MYNKIKIKRDTTPNLSVPPPPKYKNTEIYSHPAFPLHLLKLQLRQYKTKLFRFGYLFHFIDITMLGNFNIALLLVVEKQQDDDFFASDR